MGLVQDTELPQTCVMPPAPVARFNSSTVHSPPTTFLLLSDTRSVSTNSHAEFMYHHEQQKVVGFFHLHTSTFNPLNAELNPICPLLALFGAHHILHISR